VYWESVSQMQLYSGRRIFCSLTSKMSCYIQFYCKSDAVNILFDLMPSSFWFFQMRLSTHSHRAKTMGIPADLTVAIRWNRKISV